MTCRCLKATLFVTSMVKTGISAFVKKHDTQDSHNWLPKTENLGLQGKTFFFFNHNTYESIIRTENSYWQKAITYWESWLCQSWPKLLKLFDADYLKSHCEPLLYGRQMWFLTSWCDSLLDKETLDKDYQFSWTCDSYLESGEVKMLQGGGYLYTYTFEV